MDNEVKKMTCKNENCDRTILELTAKKTGGYCYPCYNAIQAKERAEYIRKKQLRTLRTLQSVQDQIIKKEKYEAAE